MNHRHIASLFALGGLLTLAFGSVDGGNSVKTAKTAVKEMEPLVCKGDDPFKLPIDDEGAIWTAIEPHTGNSKGLYVVKDHELIKGKPIKEAGWLKGSKLKREAIDAAGQLCSSNAECKDHRCTIEESILKTQWLLEFRDGADGKWELVGYFVGSLDSKDADRMKSVDASKAAWEKTIVSALGDGMPKEEAK